MEPIGRTGPFIRLKSRFNPITDIVFHSDECWRAWKIRTSIDPCERTTEIPEDQERLTPKQKVANKFRGKFFLRQIEGHPFKGPTLAEFLKLLRLE
jgi:hypothetical protein